MGSEYTPDQVPESTPDFWWLRPRDLYEAGKFCDSVQGLEENPCHHQLQRYDDITGETSVTTLGIVEMQGQVFRLKVPSGAGSRRPGRHKPIRNFSASSRRYMMRRIMRIDWAEARNAKHLVLTFPGFPAPADAKRCRRAMFKRLQRLFPEISCFWKMEPQRRGAPHFHMLCFNLPLVSLQKLWVAWRSILATCLNHHGSVALPCIKHVEDGERLAAYVAKYVGKAVDTEFIDLGNGAPVDQAEEPIYGNSGVTRPACLESLSNRAVWSNPGRFWGIEGADSIPWADPKVAVIERGPWVFRFRRCMRQFLELQTGQKQRYVLEQIRSEGGKVSSDYARVLKRQRQRRDLRWNNERGFGLFSRDWGQWWELLVYFAAEDGVLLAQDVEGQPEVVQDFSRGSFGAWYRATLERVECL